MDKTSDIIEGMLRLAEQGGADWREVFARIMAAFTDFAYRQETRNRNFIIESAVAGILGWRRIVTGDDKSPDLVLGNELLRVASMLTGSDDMRVAHIMSLLAVVIASTDDPADHVANVATKIHVVVEAVRAARLVVAS